MKLAGDIVAAFFMVVFTYIDFKVSRFVYKRIRDRFFSGRRSLSYEMNQHLSYYKH